MVFTFKYGSKDLQPIWRVNKAVINTTLQNLVSLLTLFTKLFTSCWLTYACADTVKGCLADARS